ncbi:MAG: hypothetical protein P1U44_14095 [Vicingaceae bacterium]|nr:hypothetical protein [Vicingaceae bacterium]
MKLYHYTSINALALILKNKSIRFGRLDTVNDKSEGIAKDINYMNQYTFVSCWTNSSDENLTLWNMYSKNMRGVKLEFETPIFNSYQIGDVEDCLVNESGYVNEERGYYIVGMHNEPYEVKYTNEEELLYPSIFTPIGLNLSKLAVYKREIWRVENEYRYRLDIVPIGKKVPNQGFDKRYVDLVGQGVPPPMKGYFLKIADESFAKLKIICGPKLIDGDFEIINSLVSTYNPTATIVESDLQGLIR